MALELRSPLAAVAEARSDALEDRSFLEVGIRFPVDLDE